MADEKIYKAISDVMKDIGAVGKDKKNPQQGYKYRGIDDVMNALQPAMIKHGIFVVPTVCDHNREERKTSKGGLLIYSVLTISYRFYAEDGSYVEAVVIGEGMDSGDKATNKALSVGFKYACFQVFCIPTEEMIDSEVDSPQPLPKGKSAVALAEQSVNLVDQIRQLAQAKGVQEIEICNQGGVTKIEDMPPSQMQACINWLAGM